MTNIRDPVSLLEIYASFSYAGHRKDCVLPRFGKNADFSGYFSNVQL